MVHFTKVTAKHYHDLFNSEIEAIAKKYGFTFEPGNGRYSDDSMSMTFTIKSTLSGEKYTPEEIRDANFYYKSILPEGVDNVLSSRWTNGKTTFVLDKIASRGKFIFHMRNENPRKGPDVVCYSLIGLKSELKCIS